jgi:hypothetical protein
VIDAYRVVELRSGLYAQQATSTLDRARYLESVFELTKPTQRFAEWHPLLAAPFRYPVPVAPAYQARFRPPFYPRNVLYAAKHIVTALYEHAFHFLKERAHLVKAVPESGYRRIFTLGILTPEAIVDLRSFPESERIMDRNDYGPSHTFMQAHPEVRLLAYPSVRDPERRDNLAIFDINTLAKDVRDQAALLYYFNPKAQSLVWRDLELEIPWSLVC